MFASYPSASPEEIERLLQPDKITLEADLALIDSIPASTTYLTGSLDAGSNDLADLLDRLAFDVVAAPPLRKRRDDILLLAAHFANAAARELGLAFPGFSADAATALKNHDWPGNVRELKNAAERAVFHWAELDGEGLVDNVVLDPFEAAFGPLTAPEPPDAHTPPAPASAPQTQYDLRAHLNDIEKTLVSAALAAHGGNQKQAAEHLSLTYDQMRGLVRKHDLS